MSSVFVPFKCFMFRRQLNRRCDTSKKRLMRSKTVFPQTNHHQIKRCQIVILTAVISPPRSPPASMRRSNRLVNAGPPGPQRVLSTLDLICTFCFTKLGDSGQNSRVRCTIIKGERANFRSETFMLLVSTVHFALRT